MDNIASVHRLRTKIEEWTSRIEGTDVHSISRQISAMLWRSAFYRSINESRRMLKVGNGSLHGLINEGYVGMHSAAIRRLVDRGSYEGPKGVNSLAVLIEAIRKHRELLSRENVLASRGLIYDYEPLREQALKHARDSAKGEGAHFVPMHGWWPSEYWHTTWDELSRKREMSRSPDDRPQDEGFQLIHDRLAAVAKDVGEYATKYVAHASTQESRATLATDQQSVSLDKLWSAECAIVQVARFMSRCFGSGSELGGVPTPQFDQFEHLEQPFVVAGARAMMEAAWASHANKIDSCRHWIWME